MRHRQPDQAKNLFTDGDAGSGWSRASLPSRVTIAGRYARLEPIELDSHLDGLSDVVTEPGSEERYRFLGDPVPADRAAVARWIEGAVASPDRLFWAVIDDRDGKVVGRQALVRPEPQHGCIEFGAILWGSRMARTRIATEAFFLMAEHAFGTLGYRRLEWKCDNRNDASRRAAVRFGFLQEGLFRQHMVVKGWNRDTAWFSIVDGDWPSLREACRGWLDPGNFDAEGRQFRTLGDFQLQARRGTGPCAHR